MERKETSVQRAALGLAHARHDLDTRLAQHFDATSLHFGKGVDTPDDHPGNPLADNQFRTRRCLAIMGTGFQTDIQRTAPQQRAVAHGGHGIHFGMRPAATYVIPLAHNVPVAHQDRPHHGIGRGTGRAVPGYPDAALHPFFIFLTHTLIKKKCNFAYKQTLKTVQPHPLTLFRARLSSLYEARELRAVTLLVMEQAFGVSRLDVYADKVRHFSADEACRLENILQRLAQGEPVQYVLGEATFAGRPFRVGPGVLIPRPETEELTDWILSDYTHRPAPDRLLDVGCGSGCIAVTLACALPRTAVTAWDISEEALRQTAFNAERHGATVRCEYHNLLENPVANHPFDLIVSNPPYICHSEQADMEHRVLDHEPALALFVPDAHPLLFYRQLARLAGTSLSPEGSLYLEINRRFGPELLRLFRSAGFTQTELRADSFGADRMIRVRR